MDYKSDNVPTVIPKLRKKIRHTMTSRKPGFNHIHQLLPAPLTDAQCNLPTAANLMLHVSVYVTAVGPIVFL